METSLDSQTDTTIRASHWGITINNPTEDDRRQLRTTQRWLRRVRGQDERGENGTLHIQAYANTDQVRLSQLKVWLPRAHFKALFTKDHIDNMVKYVHKEDATTIPDTKFDMQLRTNANTPLTMANVLALIAECAWSTEQVTQAIADASENGERLRLKDVYEKEYWQVCQVLLARDENLVGLLTQPQYMRAWINTRQVWITKNRLDSQTTIEILDSPPDSPVALPP